MRPRYRQFVCSTLTLTVWCIVAYSLYFLHMATQEFSQTDSRAVETANESLLPSEDVYTSEWTTKERPISVTIDNATQEKQRIRKRWKQATSSLRTSLSQPTKRVVPCSSLSIKPVESRSIPPKPVKGKRIAVKQNSSASVTSASVHRNMTKDPMDQYSDMGGIVIKKSNLSTSVNPHPFNYTLNPRTTCDVSPSCELFLLVYVHTRPDSIKQRELIRSTWGDFRNYSVTVRRIFVMGLPNNDYVQEAIKLESNLYHDILQENFLDTYRNLTYKAVGALRWVKDHCSNAKFVLKTDDDSFVNMHVLLELLVSKHKAGVYGPRSLICNVWYKSSVPRVGKWAVTVAQRKHPRWPDFCQGLAYIMTPSVASDLYNASFDVPFLWLDDVYVTGFLAKKIGIVHTQITKHFVKEEGIERQLRSGPWRNVLFSHIHDSDRWRWAWNRVMKLMSNLSTTTTMGNHSFHTTSTIPSVITMRSTKTVVPTKPASQTRNTKTVAPKNHGFLLRFLQKL